MTPVPRTPSGWERFWYAPTPLRRLALFRLAVAWLCLYDAFLYDPTSLVANSDRVEVTWNPLVAFMLLGIPVPSAATVSALSTAYQVAVLAVLFGIRTRTACLVMALLAFWQGGLFYSLTKVRHDRVALCFATFALAFSPCGAVLSVDAWLRRGRPSPEPTSPWAMWPIRLTQATIVIGYAAAGLTKLLHAGWMNGYTLQGIVLGHRGAFADLAAGNVFACRLLSVVTVASELCSPLCLWLPRLGFLFVPALAGFHLGTWATMDTGPYLTLWFLLIAFVPLDRVRAWFTTARQTRRWFAAVCAGWALGIVAIVAAVMASVVPWPWLLGAAAGTAVGFAADRRGLSTRLGEQ